MKVAIIGGGRRPGKSSFFLQEELKAQGVEIVDEVDEYGWMFQRNLPAVENVLTPSTKTRNTGAARIKRVAKQRRRRKGK